MEFFEALNNFNFLSEATESLTRGQRQNLLNNDTNYIAFQTRILVMVVIVIDTASIETNLNQARSLEVEHRIEY